MPGEYYRQYTRSFTSKEVYEDIFEKLPEILAAYRVISFSIPKKGNTYLTKFGEIVVCAEDYDIEPRFILEKKKLRVITITVLSETPRHLKTGETGLRMDSPYYLRHYTRTDGPSLDKYLPCKIEERME